MSVRAPAWLGVDVGTSSLKVVAVDASGFSLAEKETALPLERPTPQQAEADPRAWTRAVDDLLGPMSETYDVRAVGVTGQMHGDHPRRRVRSPGPSRGALARLTR